MSTQNWAALNVPAQGANALRFLAMDAVQKANSGHPGQPMGMADVATVLWNEFLRHSPTNPKWFNRDRFVLSAGHGSMLLYGLLYLSGYNLPLEELKHFRQLHSKTPGHPEYGHTAGVEITTGPLGQGLASAAGFALAERNLAARFNRPGHEIVDHHTYVVCGDGDMQEGVSHEGCSLAGHLGLGKLIVLYDDNHISIDGDTALSFSENIPARFGAYGWDVQSVDGHDPVAIQKALGQARARADKPHLICCRTVIGWGAPTLAGTEKTHGSPLGDAEIAATRKALGWESPPFEVPEPLVTFWRGAVAKGRKAEHEWDKRLEAYAQAFPAEGKELRRIAAGEASTAWIAPLDELRRKWLADPPPADATRACSGKVLEVLGTTHPDLIGGSADLTPSNNTRIKAYKDVSKADYGGRYIRYGVREHGMGAILNGLALHGGLVPYSGTFLVFSDYMRGSIRLAALSGLQVIYVFTHDSIGVGEDGPTHQPVEHYAALRAIPNLRVYRPADFRETLETWESALLHRGGPAALLLTRQKLPNLAGTGLGGVAKGGYVLAPPPKGLPLKALLLGTGSELHLAVKAQETLAAAGIGAQVVSMACWELFDAQPQAYRDQVLPPAVTCRVAIEAGIAQGWERYLGLGGAFVGMTTFGTSAPAEQIFAERGITAESVVKAVQARV
jgi:transketolase